MTNDQPSIVLVRGSLPEHLEDRAAWYRRQLADLHRKYLEECQPYVKELAQIEALRPIRGYMNVGTQSHGSPH